MSIPVSPHLTTVKKPRILPFLVLLLVLAAAALPLSRLGRERVPPPPRSADLGRLAGFYLSRIKSNPADTDAYVRLAAVNEQRGFYLAALDRVGQARALGVTSIDLAGIRGRCLVQLARYEEAIPELEAVAKAKPGSVNAAIDLAQLYWDADRLPDSAKVLQFYLQHHPELAKEPDSSKRADVEKLMVAFAHAGDAESAVRMAENVINIAPGEPNGYAVAGKNLLALRRYAEAESRLKEAVRLAPKLGELRYLHGMALSRLPGRKAEALAEWQKAVDLNDRATDAWYEIGREYERRKDFRRSAIAYMRAGDNADRGSEPYRKASEMWKRAGRRAESVYCRGRAESMVKDFQAALPAYQELSHETDPYWRKQGLLGLVECYENLPDKQKLLDVTLKASTEGTAEDLIRIADAYGALKNYAKRTEYLRKAMEKDPSFTGHVYHQIGVIAEAGGLRDEAERQFERAAKAAPEAVDYHRKLADLYLERRAVGDRAQRAVKASERVVQLAPVYGKDYVRLGLAYRAVNDLPRALQAFQHAVDMDPGYGPAYLELGRMYKEIGNRERGDFMLALYRKYQAFDTEKQNLRTAALARPKDPLVWEKLADYFVRARDLGSAAGFYEKALSLNPRDRGVRAKLANTFGMMGRLEDQREQEQLASRQNPAR